MQHLKEKVAFLNYEQLKSDKLSDSNTERPNQF